MKTHCSVFFLAGDRFETHFVTSAWGCVATLLLLLVFTRRRRRLVQSIRPPSSSWRGASSLLALFFADRGRVRSRRLTFPSARDIGQWHLESDSLLPLTIVRRIARVRPVVPAASTVIDTVSKSGSAMAQVSDPRMPSFSLHSTCLTAQ